MKNYSKEYEDVYRGKLFSSNFKVECVSAYGGMEINKYIALLREEFSDFYLSTFDHWVKIEWLLRKFRYNRKKKSRGEISVKYSVFLQKVIGVNSRFIRSGNQAFVQVSTYFDELFPDFNDNNPFESKYEFPYKYVTLDFLIFVHRMDERMELLEEAEKGKMGLLEFYDYVINYSSCLNNDIGRQKYSLMNSLNYMPYIMKHKYERRKKT